MRNKIISDTDQIKELHGNLVMCHGVFDLFHIGHLDYINEAKKIGLPLVVTLTGDKFVNKGPGRPRFKEAQRAKMLAAIEAVDYVYINQESDAISLIKRLRPKYYCKGKDYKDPKTDVTNKISQEEDAVISVGGELLIIDTDLESSSELINQQFSSLSENQQNYIRQAKESGTIADVVGILDKFSTIKVCLIGEIILDRYVFCNPENLSSKSPTVSAKFLYEETYLGGVLAVARNLHELGIDVEVYTLVGKDLENTALGNKLNNLGFPIYQFVTESPTPIKTRYIKPEKNQRLFELFEINTLKTYSEDKTEMINQIKSRIKSYNTILVTDFGHGLFNPQFLDFMNEYAQITYLNAQTNSENYGFNLITKYNDLAYFSIDEREARLALSDRFSDIDVLVDSFGRSNQNSAFSITLGSRGSVYRTRDGRKIYCPAYFDMGLDATGAGDLYFAFTSLLTSLHTDPYLVSLLGNLYAGLKTRIQGNSDVVSKVSLIKTVTALFK
jgi:rfaE bifunctional protein nucleotidyltransferase chain/domain